ncbi:MAG: addiction module antidote protein, HigA family [Flavobacterium sp.]|nr:MAG: addiction module antidote protein, HigA family [Flavobacterium sp.]
MKRTIRPNTHPGEILREEVLGARGLSIDEACKLLDIPRPTLSNILEGKSSIAPIAIKIAQVFGGNPELWTRMQTNYDLREADTAKRK